MIGLMHFLKYDLHEILKQMVETLLTLAQQLVTFVKIFLEYSDDYARSVTKSNLWYSADSAAATNPNRPFAAKPSRDLLFIKIWAIT